MEIVNKFCAKLQLGEKERLERSRKIDAEIKITFNKIIASQNKMLKILKNEIRRKREFRKWFEGIEERDKNTPLAKKRNNVRRNFINILNLWKQKIETTEEK